MDGVTRSASTARALADEQRMLDFACGMTLDAVVKRRVKSTAGVVLV